MVEYKLDRMHLQVDHLSRLSDDIGFSPVDDMLVHENFFLLPHNSSGMPGWWSF